MVRDASLLAGKPEVNVSVRARARAMAVGGCLVALSVFVLIAQAGTD